MKTYLVGGAVRDALLNQPIIEKDWVIVGGDAESIINMGYKPVGKDFPVFLHPETKEEYALARTERKTGRGYTGFACYASPEVTLEEDLQRRDLTINAMAMDHAGNLIDPYGGKNDLKNRLLRHVSPAFEEDPVRLLRIARFSARFHHLGFRIAPETEKLMRQMVRAGSIHDLVHERVWNELVKSLAEKNPVCFFQVLRECDALRILMPEIEALFGVPNPPKWHPEIDSGWHTYMVLEQATILSDSPLIRFAALVHDLGKACTAVGKWPSHHHHDESGVDQIKKLSQRMKIPKDYEKYGILASRFHSLIHRSQELTPATLLTLLENMDAFRQPNRFYDILTVCQADARGRPTHQNDPYPQKEYLTRLLTSLNQISVKPFLEAGLTGSAIATALNQARIEFIKQFIRGA